MGGFSFITLPRGVWLAGISDQCSYWICVATYQQWDEHVLGGFDFLIFQSLIWK